MRRANPHRQNDIAPPSSRIAHRLTAAGWTPNESLSIYREVKELREKLLKDQAEFESLLTSLPCLIVEAKGRAIMAGVKPTELWLGPLERRALCALMGQTNWRHSMMNQKQLYEVGLIGDGATKFEGLTIRFMQNDGLRAGASFEAK